jgi:GNAT superfamily N-acetyltransferase
MRFRWDWLRPVVTVPYIPTLGAVHPSTLTTDLFYDILRAAGDDSRRFLPYDKDQRWFDAKGEQILVGDIDHRPRQTLLPTLSQRGQGIVKVHVYGVEPNGLSAGAELAQKLCATHQMQKGRIVWFLGPEHHDRYASGTRVQLKNFTTGPGPRPRIAVRAYSECPPLIRHRFSDFAGRMATDGFAFLHEQIQTGEVGPVLTVVHRGQVAGAIGPMETMRDAVGATQLMPQYFGVLPEHRGRGYGRALWRAAMHWGYKHGADYQLLQTEVGGASDRLCRSEGLTSLGFVCSQSV